jgi:hypothetical protein
MRLPGYFAEVALASAAGRGAGKAGPQPRRTGIVPQQEFPPGRERPPIMGCDLESVFEVECAPCRLRVLPPWPPTVGPRFVWRESVRRCIICYDQNGQAYPRCGPCFERACSPFVVLDRIAGIRLS